MSETHAPPLLTGAQTMAEFVKPFASEGRIAILEILELPLTLVEISEALGQSKWNVERRMTALIEAKLVTGRGRQNDQKRYVATGRAKRFLKVIKRYALC